MSTAVLFPGQGTELAPVITAWAEDSVDARRRLQSAADLLEVGLETLLEHGGARLRSTVVGQPMLTALTLAIHSELKASGMVPNCVAGHSLGEIAAWAASGSIPDDRAIALSVQRGAAMGRAAAARPGGMIALPGADAQIAHKALSIGRTRGIVDLAAHNAPDEWVLTGELVGLHAVSQRYSSRRLDVDGAWHSRLMVDAEARFREALADENASVPRVPFYCNANGRRVDEPDRFVDVLGGQLTRPIHWVECVVSMHEAGADRFVVCGPGKALRGLVRRILGPAVAIRVVERIEDLQLIME